MNPMTSYEHCQQTWDDALAVLASWISAFTVISRPEQLNFDVVADMMAEMPGGLQRFPHGIPLDSDAIFIDCALDKCPRRPDEVIVIPDCGMTSRHPFRMPLAGLNRFIAEFEYEDGSHRLGLLDGASDILFAFNTGQMLLIDHDERVWFSQASSH
jgi:hypothetical protein